MEELLKRAQKLLDKGNIRYSDRLFEEERIKLAQDIADYFAKPSEVEEQPKKRVYLPVIQGDVE